MEMYEPKNILITGAAGFIGSHVANRLVTNYPRYNILVIDKMDYCSSLRNLEPSQRSPNFKFIEGDIAIPDLKIHQLLMDESIDTVMHFAAQTHVDNSFGNSFEFTKNNVYCTHVLLEACRQAKITWFIYVSTDEVYGESDADAVVGKHEESRLLPTNPYSASKAGAEMLVMAYGSSYDLPVIITRGNNVYGPNQFPEKLVPKFLLLAMRGLPLPVHGNSSSARSYLYCDDVAEAFDVVLHKGEAGHVYNIAATKERRVIDVARDICAVLGVDAGKAVSFVADRPFNDQRYFVDGEKLRRLGWSERTPWEEGLKRTVKWYASNPDYWGDVGGALRGHHRDWISSPSPSRVEEAKESSSNKRTKATASSIPSEFPAKYVVYMSRS